MQESEDAHGVGWNRICHQLSFFHFKQTKSNWAIQLENSWEDIGIRMS
jgi:hypothetical protein